jgi:hypothetical protein
MVKRAKLARDERGRIPSTVEVPPPDPIADAVAKHQRLQGVEPDVEVVRKSLERQASDEIARGILANARFRPPTYLPTLADELAEPEPPLPYTLRELHPQGSNALLAAQYKAGKTTLLMNLVRTLADGDSFLGRFALDEDPGHIAFLNYELTDRQFRAWIRDLGIANADLVTVIHLRGENFNLAGDVARKWLVESLLEHDISTVILDPFARAFRGDENSNQEVGVWLELLDQIKAEAGVLDLFLATHFGRGKDDQRARGATRLDDWADVRWTLSLENPQDLSSTRYLQAHGRDVDLPSGSLFFEESTRILEWVGEPKPSANGNGNGVAPSGRVSIRKKHNNTPEGAIRELEQVLQSDEWQVTSANKMFAAWREWRSANGDEGPGREAAMKTIRVLRKSGHLVDGTGGVWEVSK